MGASSSVGSLMRGGELAPMGRSYSHRLSCEVATKAASWMGDAVDRIDSPIPTREMHE